MIGEFAVLFRQNGAPTFVAEVNDLGEAVIRAKETAETRGVECFVYCYKERTWKYRAGPTKVLPETVSAASA